MRTGSCSVQQGLTSEAASIVKQAVTLAKRRGHAQVTPLHVANTMLSITNGLLRRACIQSQSQSHSHPLQCKALELCFNVALNRLPASSSSSSSSSSAMLGSHHHHYHHHQYLSQQCPSISNALVAAFKRAQAHQRRGSIENHQQQLLAVKIELEQLVISILDDPSVSRVMREAGFSSTQVKSNVEKVVSLEISAHNNNKASSKENSSSNKPTSLVSREDQDDVASVIDNLGKQRRKSSIVILGESLVSVEGVVRGVMDKVDKGDVCESLRGVKFVSLSLSGFSHVSRVEVEQKIQELRSLVQQASREGGYVLYLGDLKWVFEYRGRGRGSSDGNYYCGVDHMVMEIGKLVSGIGEYCGSRFWIMGIATFRDYMTFNNGHPSSLEALWGLHPITIPIPARTLRLSLLTDQTSYSQNQSGSKKADDQSESTRSSLPTWLQQCKDERKVASSNNQRCVQMGDLGKVQVAYPALTAPPSSAFSYERSVIEPTQSHRDHNQIQISETCRTPIEPTFRIYIPENNNNNNTNHTNHQPSNSTLEAENSSSKFKVLNSENMKTLCNALQEKVPWQKDIIPEIVSTVLQCRSGMLRRKGSNYNNESESESESNSNSKRETWLFFQGADMEAKERIARELARLVFGCEANNLVSIALSSFISRFSPSNNEDYYYCRNKRSRDEASCSYINRFGDAVSCNPHRVFLVEDIEQADYFSQVGFQRAIERGRVKDSNGDQVSLCDAIIILSCESFSSRSSSNKQKSQQESISNLEEAGPPCVSLDLNICIDDHDHDEDDYDNDDYDNDVGHGLLQSVDRRIVFKIQDKL